MPALTTDERNAFDNTIYPAVGYVYISQPELVFEAPLVGVFYSNDAIVALDYGTPTTGAYTDIEPEQTLEIWSDGANRHGSQRIRKVATASAIFVGRSPEGTRPGELSYVDGATIRVYNERRAWAKNPYIDPNTGTQYKDELAYPSDNLAQVPVANAGPDVLIISDTGSEAVSLNALGTVPSFTVRNGATLSSYLWDIADGTTGDTLSDSEISVTFGYGERYVALKVTDSNGASHTCYKFVVVARRGDCVPAKIVSETIRPSGVTLGIEVDSALLPSASRPNAKMLYGTDTTHGVSGSKQLLFSGWIATEQWQLADAKSQKKTITIECHDVATRLRGLYGFPLTVSNQSSETGWYRMPNASIDRLTHHYLQWHSNVLALADFAWSGQGATYPLPEFTTSGASLWEQASRLAKAIAYRLTCSTSGALRVKGDPLVLPTSEQATEYSLSIQRTSTIVTTLTDADYGKVKFTGNQRSPYFWVRSAAVVASATVGEIDAVKCSAPGKTPAQGTSSVEESELLVISQDELNVRAGNDYAARKSPEFSQFTFEMVKTKQVFEPADMEWVTIVLPADARARYPFLSDSGNRFVIDEIINRYDHKKMKRSTSILATIEVEGIPAQTVIDPPQATDTYSGYEWDDYYVPVVPDNSVTNQQSGLVAGTGNIVAILDNGKVAVTTNFSNPSWEDGPSWVVYDHTAILGTSVLQYAYQANAMNISAWLVTPTKIIHASNLQSATPTFTTQHTFATSSIYRNIDADYINAPGLFAVVVSNTATQTEAVITLDGVNWSSPVQVSNGAIVGSPGVAVNPRIAGTAYSSGRTLSFQSQVKKMSGFSNAWSFVNNLIDDDGSHGGLIMPYADTSGTILFYGEVFAEGTGSQALKLIRGVDGGSVVNISPVYGGRSYGLNEVATRFSISVADTDANKLAFAGIDDTQSKFGLFLTQNALNDSPSWVSPIPPEIGIPYRRCALVNGAGEIYVFGVNGNIAYSANPYQTGSYDNRIGNLSTVGSIIGIAGF